MQLTRRLTIGCATLVAAATAAGPALAADTHVNAAGMSPNASVATLAVSTANQDTAFNFFVGKGLTKRQAAGVVGNLTQESGVNPNAQQAGGAGRGIAQWSVGGRWDRYARDNMVWYAANKAGGVSRWNLNAQLKFTWYELNTYSYYGLAQLKGATAIRGAVLAFQNKFEGCGTCMTDKRVTYAQQVYNRHT